MAAVATKVGLLERLALKYVAVVIGRLSSANVQFTHRDEEVG